jgi:uncharacterized membrane protein
MAYQHTIPHSALGTARPAVNTITVADLREALRRGYDDFKAMPSHAVFLCVIYPVIGVLIAGLAVVMPILGHATWHLYRKVVVR